MLGISGASGAAYAQRVLEQLLLAGAEVHLVVSDYGRRLLAEEAGVTRLELGQLVPTLAAEAPTDDVADGLAQGTRTSRSWSVARVRFCRAPASTAT